ncbi:MAG: hypothetical protein ABW110_23190 [Steroidobacteraceae bacterium]
MAEVLGRRPDTLAHGLQQLSRIVAEDPQRHAPRLLPLFSAIERRHEVLFEPAIRSNGLAFGAPLAPVLP